jgi:hypothetical protein
MIGKAEDMKRQSLCPEPCSISGDLKPHQSEKTSVHYLRWPGLAVRRVPGFWGGRKDATIYPVQLMNADGSPLMKVFFFKEGELWAIFDEAGQVMRETK